MRANFVATIIALFCLGIGAFAQAGQTVTLDNEFIAIVVNATDEETGRFAVRTTGGDPANPASRNQHLVFGDNVPWTSYTTIRIGEDSYAFGGPTKRRAGLHAKFGTVTGKPEVKNGAIVTVCQYGDIEVAQELRLARSTVSRMLDTAGITYRITNKGTETKPVGVRVTLDTMCGTNDGAPIRLGAKEITKPLEAAGEDLVDRWFAFDDLVKPTVISMGTLHGGDTTAPDRVIYTDWGSQADIPWSLSPDPEKGFIRTGEVDPDTAAAMYWDAKPLDAGQTRTITTYYGLGYLTGGQGVLKPFLDNPAETTFEHERTQLFTVTGFVKNTGNFDGRDVIVTLALPKGLELVGGNKLKETYEGLKSGAMIQQSWTLKADGKFNGVGSFKLTVDSANIEASSVQNNIQVNVPTMKLRGLPGNQQVPLVTNRKQTIIPIQLNLSPVDDFTGMRVVVKFDPTVIHAFDVSRGRAFVEDGRLLTGWDVDDTEIDNGKLVITGMRTNAPKLTQAEVNLAVIKFRTEAAGKTAITLEKAVLIDEKGTETPLDVAGATVVVNP